MFPPPDDLSPQAAAYLHDLEAMLHALVLDGAAPPAHHSEFAPAAFETALAWARASSLETLGTAAPAPGDVATERYFENVVGLFPLGLEEFAFYVGLLEEALTFDAGEGSVLTAAIAATTDELSSRFTQPPSASGLAVHDPAAVLLLMYLRMYAVLTTAASVLEPEAIAARAEITMGLVMVVLRPA
jgi:hypothetical protein